MNLLLAGDSWGCGEWSVKGHLTHSGLEQYFQLHGYKITNVSMPGAGNKIIVNNIQRALQQQKFDKIFFIQTDPLRDIHVANFNYNVKWFNTYDDLQDIINRLLKKTYQQLDSFNIPIFCIGGCAKLNVEVIKPYKNLYPIIPSIIEFLGYEQPNIWISSVWHKYIDKKWDLETIDRILNEFYKRGRLQNQLYFSQDSGHPDRHGLKKVFDFLCESVLK